MTRWTSVASRRWLALELKRLRQQAGLTQNEAAKAVGLSRGGMLSQYEAGQRAAKREVIAALLVTYQVPRSEWPRYLHAAHESYRRGRCESIAEGLTDWEREYVGLEQVASRLRAYRPRVIDELLQTPEYAATTMRGPVSDELLDHHRTLLARRHEVLIQPEPLDVHIVLDESALARVFGSHAIMRDQLAHLVALMATTPNLTVQVDSYRSGGIIESGGWPFSILGFPWESDIGVVYLPRLTDGLFLNDLRDINAYSIAFDRAAKRALSRAQSIELIRTYQAHHDEQTAVALEGTTG